MMSMSLGMVVPVMMITPQFGRNQRWWCDCHNLEAAHHWRGCSSIKEENGKGLESNKSKEVLPLNQPFSPLSSPLKKKEEEETNFSSELFYGPSFFHKVTKTRKFACDEKTKQKRNFISYLSSFV